MTDHSPAGLPSPAELAALALSVADHIPAMVAYWDRSECCRFANRAYLAWFGKAREDLIGTTLRELLGAIYELNLPYIRGALNGDVQIFERSIPRPDGTGVRESLATYIPHVKEGVVQGFFVLVTDQTLLKERERQMMQLVAERDAAIADLQKQLHGMLRICASCKRIHDESGNWVQMERYITGHSQAEFSHGLCPDCLKESLADES